MVLVKSQFRAEYKIIPKEENLYGIVRMRGLKKGATFAGISAFFEYDRERVRLYDDAVFFQGTYDDLSKCMRSIPEELRSLYERDNIVGAGFGHKMKKESIAKAYVEIDLKKLNWKPTESRMQMFNTVVARVKDELPKNMTCLVKHVGNRNNKELNSHFRTFPDALREDARDTGVYYNIPRYKRLETQKFPLATLVDESLGILPDWALEMVSKYRV